MSTSKAELLNNIFDQRSGNTVIVPLDDSAITGPEDQLRRMDEAIRNAIAGGANAILGYYGMFRRYSALMDNTAGIMNLSLSTEGPHHLRKVMVGTVEQAKSIGVAASVHINTTSPHEPEMLQALGATAWQCRQIGVPLLAHVYPRTITHGQEDHYQTLRSRDPQSYAKLVRHGARIAADLGADIIKVPFTGNQQTFATVVESAYGLPVVMAGGPKSANILVSAHQAMLAGARGIAVGRNFFQHDDGTAIVKALCAVVHSGADPAEAIEAAGLSGSDVESV